jgi:phosphatidylglycerophosphate synthase
MHFNQIVAQMITTSYMKSSEAKNPLAIIMRILSIPVVKFCIHMRIVPNAVTAISIICGCLAALFYFTDRKTLFIAVWVLSIVLDYSDGAIARKMKLESHFGYLFDSLGDRLKLTALLVSWAVLRNSLTSYSIAGTAIVILVATEFICHSFIPLRNENRHNLWKDGSLKTIIFQMFVRFDMHSFLLLGIMISFGVTIGYFGTIWFVAILGINMLAEIKKRISYSAGTISMQLNLSLFGKWLRNRKDGIE